MLNVSSKEIDMAESLSKIFLLYMQKYTIHTIKIMMITTSVINIFLHHPSQISKNGSSRSDLF